MLRNEHNEMRKVKRVDTNIVFKRHPNSVIMCILKSHVTHLERSDPLNSVSHLLAFGKLSVHSDEGL